MTRHIMPALCSLLATMILSSCGNSSQTTPIGLGIPDPNTKPPQITPPTSTRVGALSIERYTCRWSGVVNGSEEVFAPLVLRNKSNKNVNTVRVQVSFKNTLDQEVSQTFDFTSNIVPDEVNFKGPNIIEARSKWTAGWVLKSCTAQLQDVGYTN
jgi:hypothetical protein